MSSLDSDILKWSGPRVSGKISKQASELLVTMFNTQCYHFDCRLLLGKVYCILTKNDLDLKSIINYKSRNKSYHNFHQKESHDDEIS